MGANAVLAVEIVDVRILAMVRGHPSLLRISHYLRGHGRGVFMSILSRPHYKGMHMLNESTLQSPKFLRNILWLDLITGLVTGLLQVAMPSFFAQQYGLPITLILASGMGLFAYALLLTFLLTRRVMPAPYLRLLVVGNCLWPVACLWVALGAGLSVTPLGQINLLGQAGFVAGLATLQGMCLRRLSHKSL